MAAERCLGCSRDWGRGNLKESIRREKPLINTVQVHFKALGAKVQAAALPVESKHTAVWCLEKLPTLYALFLQTNESRYGDEISSLVRGVLYELANSESAYSAAQQLATTMTRRLHALHEQLGLPGLDLRTPRTSAPHAPAGSSKKRPRTASLLPTATQVPE